ncbi:MAG TPA: hypothetical protein VMQ61_15930 [Thermoanaerobaculia bacterium]|nr:hypothetical protein [Thermoanaerobaculia bacterium]
MRTGATALASLVLLAARAAVSSPPASITDDFSGEGRHETITAVTHGDGVRLEARDAAGKRVGTAANVPVPGGGRPAVAMISGSIGSAGALLEVAASRGDTVCRSVWRLRDGALNRLPVFGEKDALPDCDSDGWTSHWDQRFNEPARYVRERAHPVAQGMLHESRIYTFRGFEMRLDAAKSSAEVNGVSIPAWVEATLYPNANLEELARRYALSGLTKGPRLRFETDREKGAFAAVLSDAQGELRLPVTAAKPFEQDEKGLEITAGKVAIRLTVAGGKAPQSAAVRGAGRFDGGYASIIRWQDREIQVFASAEQELALEYLPGAWTTERRERLVVSPIAGPASVRLGDADVVLDFAGAPAGTDLLLTPPTGGPASWALKLEGPDAFRRVPVQCGPDGGDCRAAGEGQTFRRIGSQLNR